MQHNQNYNNEVFLNLKEPFKNS